MTRGQIGQFARGLDEEGPLVVVQVTQPQPLRVNPGLGGYHALHDLLGRHLQAEDSHVLAVAGGVPPDGETQAGLAYRGPGGDDDEVGALQAPQQPVNIDVAGGHAQRFALVGVEVLDAVVVPADHVLDGGQVARDAPLRDAEQRLLGLVNRLVDVLRFLVGQLGDLAGRAQQAPANGGLFDDVAVGLDVDGAGDGVDQVRDVGRAADLLQLAPALQFVAQCDEVDRLAPLVERKYGFVDPGILLDVEILPLQEGGDTKQCFGIDEEGAEDCLLSLDVVGDHLVGSCHIAS
jgi:hypothetical protein